MRSKGKRRSVVRGCLPQLVLKRAPKGSVVKNILASGFVPLLAVLSGCQVTNPPPAVAVAPSLVWVVDEYSPNTGHHTHVLKVPDTPEQTQQNITANSSYEIDVSFQADTPSGIQLIELNGFMFNVTCGYLDARVGGHGSLQQAATVSNQTQPPVIPLLRQSTPESTHGVLIYSFMPQGSGSLGQVVPPLCPTSYTTPQGLTVPGIPTGGTIYILGLAISANSSHPPSATGTLVINLAPLGTP
jgi:hypothetical protein